MWIKKRTIFLILLSSISYQQLLPIRPPHYIFSFSPPLLLRPSHPLPNVPYLLLGPRFNLLFYSSLYTPSLYSVVPFLILPLSFNFNLYPRFSSPPPCLHPSVSRLSLVFSAQFRPLTVLVFFIQLFLFSPSFSFFPYTSLNNNNSMFSVSVEQQLSSRINSTGQS